MERSEVIPNVDAGWEVAIYVWPYEDLIQHELSEDCPCGPDVLWSDPDTGEEFKIPMVEHHSLDGREQYEEDH